MAKKYQLTQMGVEVQALLNKIEGLKANQAPEQGATSTALETLALDGVLYYVVTKAVSDLVNYYTKGETYSKTEVNSLVADILQDIRQFKVLSLGDFWPSDGSHTLGTKSEAATALNITEEQVDSLLSGEYDCIEYASGFGGLKLVTMGPNLVGYVCVGLNLRVTMPFVLSFSKRFGEDVYSYGYEPLGINDVTVGGESVVTNSAGISVAAIPAIPDVSQFITRSVNDLANYYLKSETYTKDEVASLIGTIQQFHYEIAASTSSVTDPSNNVLYLIGPTGTGSDKYEEYVYSNGWVKIGDTSIDLSGYVTTEELNAALATYATKTDVLSMQSQEIENAVDAAWDNVMNA